jgi:ribosomal protein S18 acetylase RimI-like enzyme
MRRHGLVFRRTQVAEVEELFRIRAATRENALSKELLASMGITPESVIASIESRRVRSWLCLHDDNLVGFCNGDSETGELLVLAVLPDFEGKGIGRRLLTLVTEELRSAGCCKLWLTTSSDPSVRAHGFYRSLGWKPTGERFDAGAEVLVLEP